MQFKSNQKSNSQFDSNLNNANKLNKFQMDVKIEEILNNI